jgi:hypothetical protein
MNETLTTGEKILVFIVLAIGIGFFAYATIGRIFGFHRPTQWVGGAKISFVGELAISFFVICWGLTAVFHSAVFIIPAIAAFVVGFISQRRADKHRIAKDQELRKENALKYPGVFDVPPPSDIESIKQDELDIFDAGSCTYIGRVSKNDVKVLINRFKDVPDQGPNDIYMLVESIEMLPKNSVSQNFITLLKNAFEKRDYLEVRWQPPSSNKCRQRDR